VSDWRTLVEPPTDDRLPRILLALGVEHRITWQDAERLLDAYERMTQARPWQPPPPTPARTPWSNPLGDTPRDLAAWLAMCEAVAGRKLPEWYPLHWAGAVPMEAWHFDLDPVHNHGDHSGIPALQRPELSRQLELAGTLPPTHWVHERGRLLLDEVAHREQRA